MAASILHPGPNLVLGEAHTDAFDAVLPVGPIMVVTDRGVRTAGLADPIIEKLKRRGEVVVFDAVEPDPSKETLLQATAVGRDAGIMSVVGIGGGSPMDVAKLVAYLIGSNDEIDTIWGVGFARGKRLPLVLIPTTAGTGSEATPVAVITVEGDEKRGVSSAALVPDLAMLDARLTIGMPRGLTAATGVDAMVHAIEAYTSAKSKNSLSDMQAREALRLLGANLLTACNEPTNLAAREAMLLGSHLAGLAFAKAPVGGVHALAYPLGGIFHLPHGLSNALMLRTVMTFNMQAAREPYAELAVLLDPAAAGMGSQGAATRLIERCAELVVASGLRPRLRDHGIDRSDLPHLAREAMKQSRLLVNNPVPIEEEDALRLYADAW